ncbi:MAG: N utilization substance protein B-like protein [Candidatus Curtissbacteria bacterium GW2011_GWA1_40_47]|uniref:Transcription antitermination protein NusB n=1 Tax=Candidatus Curtissbacteria bacterium RIFOXYA1_FULL_41_14 TaxID=1797737 RepID=A0A1F5HGH5_9BACT|nr:MAG: N utilization substance protein B-like protein [Candidatus Curtissbacteria bacterium GW2011_GWB1_40_28]KKR61133.1 MAG: N utilization substance protein B-like protein [Candidatus Curtissbacteria bacterium GW2011_GWA2_40_31]KKR61907.1 MAG: N utilization substance protein B-like protein [Microgenomates group bacterium GW2011_GWC1_40_35]KKR65984.1 MAG: N utilization substance protein B-like protein [Candidatus Curtissbacteria bacterium GW2011_GWA1_40_47]KKR76052.1 MAG: N utilization substan
MKRKDDPRHKTRIQTVKTLFEKNFRPSLKLSENSLARKVILDQKEIDRIIAKNAPVWPIAQIATVDLAILRLAIWELVFKKKEPYKVIVDEAVEIAKEFGSETSASFVNGVLGSVIKSNIKITMQNLK